MLGEACPCLPGISAIKFLIFHNFPLTNSKCDKIIKKVVDMDSVPERYISMYVCTDEWMVG